MYVDTCPKRIDIRDDGKNNTRLFPSTARIKPTSCFSHAVVTGKGTNPPLVIQGPKLSGQ